jgi:hypothetical protein
MRTIFKNLIISSEYTRNKSAPWADHNWNHHKVRVYNRNNQKSFSFDYWRNDFNPDFRKDADCIDALRCALSDALYGENSFKGFCSDLGYDKFSLKEFETAQIAWESCVKMLKSVKRVFGEDYREIIDQIDKWEEKRR